METKNTFQRQTAVKVIINELLTGTYVQGDEQNSSCLRTIDQRLIYRFNLMGIVVAVEKQGSITNLLLDDGTGKIYLRLFEESPRYADLRSGDIILTIGKIRVYQQEKYFAPEILRKLSADWLKVRAFEFKDKIQAAKENLSSGSAFNEMEALTIDSSNKSKVEARLEPEKIEELTITEEVIGGAFETKDAQLPPQKLLHLIKELDRGEGVLVEELLSKSSLNETEKLLEKMLEKGDIFQNLPGRVKVL
ncbi:MAG: hypothetical protein AABY26_05505 [Nanoarchaeota archaeon]